MGQSFYLLHFQEFKAILHSNRRYYMAKNFTGYHLKKETLQHGRQIEHSNDWQVNFFSFNWKDIYLLHYLFLQCGN